MEQSVSDVQNVEERVSPAHAETNRELPLATLLWVQTSQPVDFSFPNLAKLEKALKDSWRVTSAIAFEHALFESRYAINRVHREMRVVRDYGN